MDDNVFQQNAKLLKSKMLNDSCALKWTSSETTAHNIVKCGWYCSEKIKIFYCGALLTQISFLLIYQLLFGQGISCKIMLQLVISCLVQTKFVGQCVWGQSSSLSVFRNTGLVIGHNYITGILAKIFSQIKTCFVTVPLCCGCVLVR